MEDDSPAVKEVHSALSLAARGANDPTTLEILKNGFIRVLKQDILTVKSVQESNYSNVLEAQRKTGEMLSMHLQVVSSLSGAIRDYKYLFFGDNYIKEFLAPALRTSACRESLDAALNLIMAKLDVGKCSSSGILSVIRLLGEQLNAPYTTLDFRDRMYVFYMETAFRIDPDALKKKKVRRDLVIQAVQSGFIAALLRLVSQPLSLKLTYQDKIDHERSRNEYAHWLTLLISILLEEVPPEMAAPYREQVESEILSASPWIWQELERYGSEWVVDFECTVTCYAPLLFHELGEVSPKVQLAGMAAGAEKIFRRMARQLLSDPETSKVVAEEWFKAFQDGGSGMKSKLTTTFVGDFKACAVSNSKRMTRRKSLFPPGMFENAEELAAAMKSHGYGRGDPPPQQPQQAQQRANTPQTASSARPGQTTTKAGSKATVNTATTSEESAPKKTFKAGSCGYCGISASVLDRKLQLCSGCKIQRYCSAQCQKDDWTHHKKACKEAQRKEAAG